MKHNQFKAIINKMLKAKCEQKGLTLSGIDITNNQKYLYVYDAQWNCVLAISLWLNDNRIHLSGTTNMEKPFAISNRPYDVTCSYTEFNKVNELLEQMFSSLKS